MRFSHRLEAVIGVGLAVVGCNTGATDDNADTGRAPDTADRDTATEGDTGETGAEECTATETATCPPSAVPVIPRHLESEAPYALHSDAQPIAGAAVEGWVEPFTDWDALEGRLSEFGAALGVHEELDFASEQVIIAWELSGCGCDGGTHFQGVTEDGVAVYMTVRPCDVRCDVSSTWFGNLLVVARGDLTACVDSWICSSADGTAEGCPSEPAYTMLNYP